MLPVDSYDASIHPIPRIILDTPRLLTRVARTASHPYTYNTHTNTNT